MRPFFAKSSRVCLGPPPREVRLRADGDCLLRRHSLRAHAALLFLVGNFARSARYILLSDAFLRVCPAWLPLSTRMTTSRTCCLLRPCSEFVDCHSTGGRSDLNCRMYENKFPEVDDLGAF